MILCIAGSNPAVSTIFFISFFFYLFGEFEFVGDVEIFFAVLFSIRRSPVSIPEQVVSLKEGGG